MWIFTKVGFLSIVQSDQDPTMFAVRGRNKKHLKALFPRETIVELPGRDYCCRVFVRRDQVEALILDQVKAIRYSNFKSAIPDKEYHDACLDVWLDMVRYETKTDKPGRKKRRSRATPILSKYDTWR